MCDLSDARRDAINDHIDFDPPDTFDYAPDQTFPPFPDDYEQDQP
ncbi:hypothetical protein BH787_gp29 [Gordonia phage GMA4]|nr:hypothetical protein BH787_gp29 [Gordonia phage GMA4]AKJ72319.1 hypothetical protein GMA4_44 [Gordonia phage GMA4]